MAFAYDRLTEITTIANSAAAVYTNPASTTAYVRLLILHNSNTTAEVVTLYNVPNSGASAGTAGVTNQIFKQTLQPNETYIWEFPVPGLLLKDENDTIQASTTTASKVTIQISGATE